GRDGSLLIPAPPNWNPISGGIRSGVSGCDGGGVFGGAVGGEIGVASVTFETGIPAPAAGIAACGAADNVPWIPGPWGTDSVCPNHDLTRARSFCTPESESSIVPATIIPATRRCHRNPTDPSLFNDYPFGLIQAIQAKPGVEVAKSHHVSSVLFHGHRERRW